MWRWDIFLSTLGFLPGTEIRQVGDIWRQHTGGTLEQSLRLTLCLHLPWEGKTPRTFRNLMHIRRSRLILKKTARWDQVYNTDFSRSLAERNCSLLLVKLKTLQRLTTKWKSRELIYFHIALPQAYSQNGATSNKNRYYPSQLQWIITFSLRN